MLQLPASKVKVFKYSSLTFTKWQLYHSDKVLPLQPFPKAYVWHKAIRLKQYTHSKSIKRNKEK